MRKCVSLCFAVLLLLSSMGAGYAHWTDEVVVEETVNTGSFSVAWTEVTCAEFYVDSDDHLVEGEWLDKDIGSCEAHGEQVVPKGPCDYAGWKKVVATVDNAYPSYRAHVIVAVTSFGSIPAHFPEILASGTNDTEGTVLVFEWVVQDEEGVFKDWVDGKLVEVANLEIANFVCEQLHQCDTEKGEFDLHFKQTMQQNHVYTFTFVLKAVQWNVS